MKRFVLAFAALLCVALLVQDAHALGFVFGGRSNVVVVNGGHGFNNAVVLNRGNRVFVNNGFNNRGFNNAFVFNRGFGFQNNRAFVGNGFNFGRNQVFVNRGFHGNGLISVNTNRFARSAVLFNPSAQFGFRQNAFFQPQSFHSYGQPVFFNNGFNQCGFNTRSSRVFGNRGGCF